MVMHTPIPYWLSLPLADLHAWLIAAGRVQLEDAAAGKDQ